MAMLNSSRDSNDDALSFDKSELLLTECSMSWKKQRIISDTDLRGQGPDLVHAQTFRSLFRPSSGEDWCFECSEC